MITPQQLAGQAYLTIGNYMLEAKAETPADTLCALMLLAGVIGKALNNCGYDDGCRELVVNYETDKLPLVQYAQENIIPAVAPGWPMQEPKHVTYHLHRWRAGRLVYWFYVEQTVKQKVADEIIGCMVVQLWYEEMQSKSARPTENLC